METKETILKKALDMFAKSCLLYTSRNRGAERRVYENRAYEAGKDHRYLV